MNVQINKQISSISFLEFINSIDSLSNNILYSPDDGYYSLKSKEAIFNFSNYYSKFEIEANKISKKCDFSDKDKILSDKKEDFLKLLNKHFVSQIPIWAQEVFDEFINNILFDLSINKDKVEIVLKQIQDAILWLSNILNLDNEAQSKLFVKYENDVKLVLNSNDGDYLEDYSIKKSDFNVFIEIWNNILNNKDEFIKQDFTILSSKLTQEDIKYFDNIKAKLCTYKCDLILDDISLIASALELMKLSKNEDIYAFIKQINNDFNCYIYENKSIKEEDKVKLIKRRMELFCDNNSKGKNYFKKLISSSNM